MISANLRHLRVFLAVRKFRSVTEAAQACYVSQPAVTQAINKLEVEAGGKLFDRTSAGIFITERGEVLAMRVERAIRLLDDALTDLSEHLRVTATFAQLTALIAVSETQNFTLAARRLGLAQPTVHRAVSQLEKETKKPLFERTSYGMVASRQTRNLAQAARLAFQEIEQANADLAELDGQEVGTIVVGALPLSRSHILPSAINQFRQRRKQLSVTIIDGIYDELLAALRRGEIDFVMGALRFPLPIDDVVQEKLFDDDLCIVANVNHPLVGRKNIAWTEIEGSEWAVPRKGVPTRTEFEQQFPKDHSFGGLVETGSILFMRELLNQNQMLGCISRAQAQAEIANGLLAVLDVNVRWNARPIGLTYRAGWQPTKAQSELLDAIKEISKSEHNYS